MREGGGREEGRGGREGRGRGERGRKEREGREGRERGKGGKGREDHFLSAACNLQLADYASLHAPKQCIKH